MMQCQEVEDDFLACRGKFDFPLLWTYSFGIGFCSNFNMNWLIHVSAKFPTHGNLKYSRFSGTAVLQL